ncbi:MAG: glycosyltransferase [Candidatus Hodarchaeales archaeon]
MKNSETSSKSGHLSKGFSVVIPVKDEVDLLFHNLNSLFKLNPNEIIICTDNPTPRNIISLVKFLSNIFERIRIIPVSKNEKYLYHQAWVRRCGFLAAKNDIILTADADLLLNRNVLKGFELIGKNNVGMVTFEKLRLSEKSLVSRVRLFTITLKRWLHLLLFRHVRKATILSGFTGLYWLYRPYWKDTEGDSIESLPVPLGKEDEKVKEIVHNTGEDVHLRNQMVKKHTVVYTARIGAKVMSDERPHEKVRQVIRGRSYYLTGKSMFSVLVHSIFFIEPLCFKTYLVERTNNPNP